MIEEASGAAHAIYKKAEKALPGALNEFKEAAMQELHETAQMITTQIAASANDIVGTVEDLGGAGTEHMLVELLLRHRLTRFGSLWDRVGSRRLVCQGLVRVEHRGNTQVRVRWAIQG